jgi:hypothetical protein
MKVFRASLALFVGLLVHLSAYAGVACEDDHPFKSPAGPLVISTCSDPKAGFLKYTLRVADKTVIEDSFLGFDSRDAQRLRWIFAAGALHDTGCAKGLYLLDLSAGSPKVTLFGVRGACNQFHWASWGKRSVIAIKNNVRFVYEDGKFTLPASGEELWRSVAPPEAGSGLTENDAKPFAKELGLPPQE